MTPRADQGGNSSQVPAAPELRAAAESPAAPQGSGNSLARVVGSGMTWILIATLISKAGATIQQVLLGYLLIPEDFGLWATSASAAALVNWLKDAGVRDLLIQRGEKEFHRLEGSVFWLAMTVNLLAAFLLASLAPALPSIVHATSTVFASVLPGLVPAEGMTLPEQWSDPKLNQLLVAWAIWMPVQTLGSLTTARLQMLLRFADTSRIMTSMALLKCVLTVLFAWLGFGPLSMVLPFIVCSCLEATWGYLLLRDKIWAKPVDPSIWPGILGNTKWLMLGVLGTNLFEWGGILAGGLRVTDDILGLYVFARQIPMQIFIVLSSNLKIVLFPTLSTFKDDLPRMADATLRALRVQMLITAPACLGLALIAEPLVRAVWRNGQWKDAALPAAILSVFFAFRITFGLTTSVLTAVGKFKAWALLTILEGVGLGVAAGIGAGMKGSATAIALAVGMYLMVSRLLMILFMCRAIRLNPLAAMLAVLPPWGWSVAVAFGCTFFRTLFFANRGPITEVVGLGLIFTVLFIYGTRLLMPVRMNEFVQILPGRIRASLRAVLRLPELGKPV